MKHDSSERKVCCFRSFVLTSAVLLSACSLLLIFAYWFIAKPFIGENFGSFLNEKIENKTGLTGKWKPLHWSGLSLMSEGYKGTGNQQITALELGQLKSSLSFRDLFKGGLKIRNTTISDLYVEIDLRNKPVVESSLPNQEPSDPSLAQVKKKKNRESLLSYLLLESLELRNGFIDFQTDDGRIEMGNIELDLHSKGWGSHYDILLRGATLKGEKAWLSEISRLNVQSSIQDEILSIDQAEFHFGEEGKVLAKGIWNQDTDQASIDGSLEQIDLSKFLSGNWVNHFSGKLSSTFLFEKNSNRQSVHGEARLENVQLRALPILDQLAALTKNKSFRELPLDQMTAKWSYSDESLSVYDLVIVSQDVLRLEGRMSVKDQRIEGDLRMGITPKIARSIPGAEENIFTQSEGTLLWAPIRLSGTLDEPKEDLSERLILAAGKNLLSEWLGKSSEKPSDQAPANSELKKQLLDQAESILKQFLGK